MDVSAIIVAVTLAFAAEPIVEIAATDGTSARGTLQAVTAAELVVSVDGNPRTFPTKELLSVVVSGAEQLPNASDAVSGPRLTVDLHDGSLAVATSCTLAEGRLELRPLTGDPLTISARLVRAVRFKAQDATVREQWQALAERLRTGDHLVIRKSQPDPQDASRSITVVDALAGVIQAVTADAVRFELDGQAVDVPMARVEGILLAPAAAAAEETACRFSTRDGSVWNARQLVWDGNAWQLTSTGGAALRFPTDALHRIDYGVGNLVYLADLTPESVEWTPLVAARGAEDSLRLLYEPRSNRSFFGDQLAVGGNPYGRGLALRSRTRLSYRLSNSFEQLVLLAGLDSSGGERGQVELVIQGDGRELFRQTFTSDAPVDVQLPIAGVRRLTLTVDFGPDGTDFGDFLNLAEARLTK